ncbi:hypothetical protein HID58_071799 [Brassica napus]|uniref:Ubiquitin receptor RAD23 n=1 Tax=Brassica napus TaxID=3708 RepID=A0ABQ7Z2L1_BRANA|nr:hypothetical protein HID58_071799 [Brassica napus]
MSCPTRCGGIDIPYPFGIGEGCYLNKWYEIKCDHNNSLSVSGKLVPVLFVIGKEVVSISFPGKLLSYGSDRMPYGKVRIKNPIISKGCSRNEQESTSLLNLTGSPFYVSDSNTLVAIGCNNKASLTNIEPSIVGCFSSCLPTNHTTSKDYLETVNCNSKSRYDDDGYGYCSERSYINETSCNGNRCCKASMPGSIQQVVGVRIDDNTTTRGGCKVAFLTYDQAYSLLDGSDPNLVLAKRYSTVEFGWFIHTTDLLSFVDSLKFADAIEVTREIHTFRAGVKGSLKCVFSNHRLAIGFGSSFGSLIFIGGIYGLYRFIRKQRRLNQKKKFFKRNGGLLLQQQLISTEGSVEKTRVFSSRELKKATLNFCLTRILGQGGQGTVYKGMLVDGRIVAVKKSKVVDEDKLEEFVNEVVILSQINHRNIVKLLGCCLETDVPVLVYEFIPNGNLFEHLHEDESDDHTMTTWEVRLRIAIDIAGALSYLHSAASSPIYHRDVKSTNIMLDEKYRAKVSDFGTSRTVTVDHTHLTTVVSGTVGYVDPEYFQSSQFTDKSDVYSFGVVLAELITGEKSVSFLRSQENRTLSTYFILAMKENRLFDIIDARIRDGCKLNQVIATANLARKCLNLKGRKRPSMREVSMELEKIRGSSVDMQLHEYGSENEEENEEQIVDANIELQSWNNIAVTAPTSQYDVGTSTLPMSDVEPLFPFQTRVQSSDTIMAVKKNIEDSQGKDNYPCGQQLLIHNGKVLKDETTLVENKVTEEGFLVVMLSKSRTAGSSSGQSSTQPASTTTTTSSTKPAAPSTTQSTAVPASPVTAQEQPAAQTDTHGQVASSLASGNRLEPLVQQLMDMGGGSWDKETVTRALRAAHNNPERAVDYLYSGIPETAEVAVAASGAALVPPASGGPNSSPLDLFPQGTVASAGTGDLGTLEFLRNNDQFQQLRTMVHSNPQILQVNFRYPHPELGKQNPQLLRLIQENQAEFLQLVNEPYEGSDGDADIFDQPEQETPHSINVTQAEQEAIQRLEAMGFDRDLVIEAFLACDRNEELAANYLLENSGDFAD